MKVRSFEKYVSVKRLSMKERQDIVLFVRRRDNNRCVIHGTPFAQVHEILQKSSGAKNSAKVFDPKLMACVCEFCHGDVHRNSKKIETNRKLLVTLKKRHGYIYSDSIVKKYNLPEDLNAQE